MKVTVSFDTVRVVVPCGDGQMQVGELIDQAVSRFSKVKSAGDRLRVTVHHLKSADGGILDPDDRLVDVVDDKDQLNASYELSGDCTSPPPVLSSSVELRQHGGGDGTSACGSPSEGASGGGPSSPDVFRAPIGGFTAATFMKAAEEGGIIVTASSSHGLDSFEELSILDLTSSPLAAKAGTRLYRPAVAPRHHLASSTPRRLHTTTVVLDNIVHLPTSTPPSLLTHEPHILGNGGEPVAMPTNVAIDDDDNDENGAFFEFTRDPARKSLNNNVAMMRWLDAQERLQDRIDDDDEYRKDPVGSSDEAETSHQKQPPDVTTESSTSAPSGERSSSVGTLVVLENPRCPLGIHVVPGLDAFRRNNGLVIHSIESKSPVERDGRLQVNDRIHEVNGSSLIDLDFTSAQEVFKSALRSSKIRLRVVTTASASNTQATSAASTSSALFPTSDVISPPDGFGETPRRQSTADDETNQSPKPSVSKKARPPVPERTTSAAIVSKAKFAPISSTRQIGHVTCVDLVKGSQGLGFSVTTRDNLTGEDSPIYVKNILPQGAAVVDGRLLPGDRLLQVNGVDMTGKSQEDVVSMLRGVHVGDVVTLMISRNVAMSETPDDVTVIEVNSTPASDVAITTRNSPASSRTGNTTTEVSSSSNGAAENSARMGENENDGDDYIALCISVEDGDPKRTSLLGASIKGKTTTRENGSRDLGLFVKEIIKGSAAEKDGRLMPDDRLVELNGVSLVGRPNAETMKVLRDALRSRGPSPGTVDLVVARSRAVTTAADSGVWESTPRRRAQLADGQDSPSSVRGGATVSASTTSNSSSANATSRQATAAKPGHPPTLRNASYYKANGELSPSAVRTSEIADVGSSAPTYVATASAGVSASTIVGGRSETFLIETEGGASSSFRSSSSSNGSSGRSSRSGRQLRLKRVTPPNSAADSLTRDRPGSGNTKRPAQVVIPHDVTIESSESSPLDIVPINFSREGLGRQSMSEKRKGHVDPRVTAFYQQVRMARGNQNGNETEDPLRPNGNKVPTNSGGASVRTTQLYRCCSLESVSMAPHVLGDMDEDQKGIDIDPFRRNRGCNDSFRAAVDRSYVKGRNTANSDKQGAYVSANGDEVDGEKKNGRKQKTLFQAFGDVFKIGKSKGSERDKAEKAYSLRDAEVQKELENIAREVAVSKSTSRPTNERLVGQPATSSPVTSVRRGTPSSASPSAAYVARHDNGLPQQWSSPEYAVLAPHRVATSASCNCRVPCDCKAQSSTVAPGGHRAGDAHLQPARTTSTFNIAQLQPNSYHSNSRTPTPNVGSYRPPDEHRPYRPSSSDAYHSGSTGSLQRQQHRRVPMSASPLAYQQHPAAKPLHYGDGVVIVGSSGGLSGISRPSNGVALPVAGHREDRNNRLADKVDPTLSNSYSYDNRSGSLTRQRTANGFAIAGNHVQPGAAYKFSQPANV